MAGVEQLDMEDVALSREAAGELLAAAPSQPKADLGPGDLLFDVVDSMERFTLERIILVAKKVELDEELLLRMLQANQELAHSSRGRLASGKRAAKRRQRQEDAKQQDCIAASLADSGLL